MKKKLLGHVGVDSAQLVITDPCYIDSAWKKEEFKDIRIYRHKTLKKLFGYNKSKLGSFKIENFTSYEAKTSTGKTMNEMILKNEVKEVPIPTKNKLIGSFSYAGCCETTINDKNQITTPDNEKAVVVQTGYGDGYYQVYGYFNKDGRCMKIEINFN